MRYTRIIIAAIGICTVVNSAQADFTAGAISYAAGDYEAALKEFKESATSGDPYSQLALGFMYDNGDGVTHDPNKATEWYKKASEKDLAEAFYVLGNRYRVGLDLKKDLGMAFSLYLKAAKQNLPEAQRRVGFAYVLGNGVEKNFDKGFSWTKKAAENGDRFAQEAMGYLFQNGDGVEKNVVLAGEWLRKAAENGNFEAAVELGKLYLQGLGVQKNLEESVKWFRIASENGSASAQSQLGGSHEFGTGVPKNLFTAFELYKKSAMSGDTWGQHNLAQAYYFGEGVEKNVQEAAFWFRCAAESGFNEAEFNIGVLYEKGDGVEKNLTKARMWYGIADTNGYKDAKNAILLVEKMMSKEEVERKKKLDTTRSSVLPAAKSGTLQTKAEETKKQPIQKKQVAKTDASIQKKRKKSSATQLRPIKPLPRPASGPRTVGEKRAAAPRVPLSELTNEQRRNRGKEMMGEFGAIGGKIHKLIRSYNFGLKKACSECSKMNSTWFRGRKAKHLHRKGKSVGESLLYAKHKRLITNREYEKLSDATHSELNLVAKKVIEKLLREHGALPIPDMRAIILKNSKKTSKMKVRLWREKGYIPSIQDLQMLNSLVDLLKKKFAFAKPIARDVSAKLKGKQLNGRLLEIASTHGHDVASKIHNLIDRKKKENAKKLAEKKARIAMENEAREKNRRERAAAEKKKIAKILPLVYEACISQDTGGNEKTCNCVVNEMKRGRSEFSHRLRGKITNISVIWTADKLNRINTKHGYNGVVVDVALGRGDKDNLGRDLGIVEEYCFRKHG
jgi:TPR repeat protein